MKIHVYILKSTVTRVCFLIICFQPNPMPVFFVLSKLYIFYDTHYDLHFNDILYLIYLNKIMNLNSIL